MPAALPHCHPLQVNEGMAAQLFSGRLRIKMHVQHKAGAGGATAKAGRGKKAAGAAMGAEAGTSGRGAATGAAMQRTLPPPQQRQQLAEQGQGEPEDPIDLCDDDDDDGEGCDQTRVALVREALHQLNDALKKQFRLSRVLINTSVQTRVSEA